MQGSTHSFFRWVCIVVTHEAKTDVSPEMLAMVLGAHSSEALLKGCWDPEEVCGAAVLIGLSGNTTLH